MGAARNFIYIRPAYLMYDTELLTQTNSKDHPATNHCVQQALHQRLFRLCVKLTNDSDAIT